MKEILSADTMWLIISGVAVPIVSVVIAWILSFKNAQVEIAKKWKCPRKENVQLQYLTYFLVIMIVGGFFLFAAAVVSECIREIIIDCFGMYIPSVIVTVMRVSIFTALIVWSRFTVRVKENLFELKKGIKYRKRLRHFMINFPYVFTIWMCGFTQFGLKYIDFTMCILMILCEITALVIFSNKRENKYKWVVLYFQSNKKCICATENVDQEGNWIVVKNSDNSKEVRYPIQDLLKAEYV